MDRTRFPFFLMDRTQIKNQCLCPFKSNLCQIVEYIRLSKGIGNGFSFFYRLICLDSNTFCLFPPAIDYNHNGTRIGNESIAGAYM